MELTNNEKPFQSQSKLALLPWVIWFLSAFFYFYENLIQVSPGVMTHDLMKDLSLDAVQLGNLAGIYFYTYAFIQIPAGVLADNYPIRSLLVFAITSCAFGCALFAMSFGVWQAGLGRLFIGLGSGFAAICCMRLATIWFPARKFSFLVGVMITLGMTGSIVGGGPLAVLVDQIGWRYSLYLLAFLGLILIIGVIRFVGENPDKSPVAKDNSASRPHLAQGLMKVISCKQSWLLAVYGGLMFAPTSIFGGLWGVPFIMEAYQLDKPTAASIVSLLFLGWVIGGPLTGYIAEKSTTKRPLLLFGSIGALLALSAIIYIHALPILILSLCVFLFGIFSSCFLPSFSLMKETHDSMYSGAALGFMNTANMAGGAIGMPLVGLLLNFSWDGVIINHVKIYNLASYVFSLSILPLMILVSIGLLFFIKEKR